jgi:hypothetical protein
MQTSGNMQAQQKLGKTTDVTQVAYRNRSQDAQEAGCLQYSNVFDFCPVNLGNIYICLIQVQLDVHSFTYFFHS